MWGLFTERGAYPRALARRVGTYHGVELLQCIHFCYPISEIFGKPVFGYGYAKTRHSTRVSLVRENVKLTCKAEGSQPISYRWTKDGKPLSLQKYEADEYTLRIGNVAISDKGNYTCTASNSFGSNSYRYTLLIIGKWLFIFQNSSER